MLESKIASMTLEGKQPIMRDSVLTVDEFGPFHHSTYTLQPGMTQSMQFKGSDIGPC